MDIIIATDITRCSSNNEHGNFWLELLNFPIGYFPMNRRASNFSISTVEDDESVEQEDPH